MKIFANLQVRPHRSLRPVRSVPQKGFVYAVPRIRLGHGFESRRFPLSFIFGDESMKGLRISCDD